MHWSGLVQTPETVTIVGTKGNVTIHGPAHCPTKATISTKSGRGFHTEDVCEDLPKLDEEVLARQAGEGGQLHHPNSEGFVYEIKAAMQAIEKGRKECSEYTWDDTRWVCRTVDAIREKIGLKYKEDLEFV